MHFSQTRRKLRNLSLKVQVLHGENYIPFSSPQKGNLI